MQQRNIAWIGTGVMGQSMAQHLMDAGHKLHVYTRTKLKAAALLNAGATWHDTPASATESCDIVFTMVGFPQDVTEVYFGEHGILSRCKPGMLLVDMTTTKPSLAEQIYTEAKTKGADFVDAPVSGGDVGARGASLSIMIGGDESAVAQLMPLFETLGKNILHQGPSGAGQHTKMVNQITIASTMVGVCEAMLYGVKAGLDLPMVLASISKGAAGCWTLDNLSPRIVDKNYDPGFFINHFIKDLEIALEEAARMDLCLPGLALANQLYRAAKAQGKGELGTHALYLVLEQLSKS
ncbi:MAG: oxidoreductase [Alteromonadaceae bacterium]|nr:MAG: oxidoreductase [Alteromonadaceae bacterium]